MSIRFQNNFIIAKKVLAQINRKMEKHVAETCSVEAYANGREQGYSIVQFAQLVPKGLVMRKVSFSENRNSDDIVVYAGKDSEFSMQGNVPGDKPYKERKFFRYDKAEEAAQFIIAYFAEGE
jgi:hypothetical protein